MSQATLPRSFYFASDGFGIEPRQYAKSGGGITLSGVAVFRSGTFRDSYGDQMTWDPLHIRQMVDNFNHLAGKGIIGGVPFRDGHPGFLVSGMQGKGNVIGWHENIEAKMLKSPIDGTEYMYLLADYTITEPYAQEKISNGTWRNRSAEIGPYRTNDEAEFYPVYMGCAYVDFSAVEGLNFSSSQGTRVFTHFGSATPSKENPVTGQSTGTTATGAPAVPQMPFGLPQAPQAPAATPSATPAAPAPFVFSIGGQNSTDPNAVQAYIRQLETFAAETRTNTRNNFVNGLAAANKITAPQVEGMQKFASSLSDQQFADWATQWDSTPANPMFAAHTGGVTNPDNSAENSGANQEIEDAKAVVKAHRLNRMPEDALKKTVSYGKLVAAGIEKA